jgi:hypothetical protein
MVGFDVIVMFLAKDKRIDDWGTFYLCCTNCELNAESN